MGFNGVYIDSYYLMLVVPAFIISLIAQFAIKSTFNKYSKVRSDRGFTGAQAAKELMNVADISNVSIEQVSGSLTDHYDPTHHVLRLSQTVYGKTSVAAIGVAAHETGHAIQHKQKYWPLVLRSTLVPVANIGSFAGPWLAVIGLAMSFGILVNIGLILFAGAIAFYLITLPVEINASHRAVTMLRDSGIVGSDELSGVKKVLTAAAFTYVASALVSMAQFLRLFLIARDRNN